MNYSNAKPYPAPFFLADGAKPFDNTLVAGLNQMAELLYAEQVAGARKRVASETAAPKPDTDIIAA